MKIANRLLSQRFARRASALVESACIFVIGFLIICLILSCLGRQTFHLHIGSTTFEQAIYAEDNHAPNSRFLTVSMRDDIHIWIGYDGQIPFAVYIALTLMYALQTVPMIFAYWYLSRVFANIHSGQIFTEQNAHYLLLYGILQFCVTVFLPFLKSSIAALFSMLPGCRISISTGQDILNNIFPSIAFIVAAYIIHYGIHLQDEVDHTL